MKLHDDGTRIGLYILDYDDDDNYNNRSYTKLDDGNELIALTAGWLRLSEGWFATVSRKDLCVVEFGTTKRSALRYARKAWKKEWNKLHPNQGRGYPRVVNCAE